MNSKIIANYLPQYHEIPENDLFWGKGYTDWVAVQRAKPLFKCHNQPKIPLDEKYYTLDNVDSIRWQADLAKKYGIYGFGIYHYWFNSDMQLLQKPAELLLNSKDIDIHFMFIWDNSTWKRTWSAVRGGNDWAPQFDTTNSELQNNGILCELNYGNEEDWKTHYDYLNMFFKDDRYIKFDGRPVFGIFNPNNDPEKLKRMITYWEQLAKECGYPGVAIISKNNKGENTISEFSFSYEPGNSGWEIRNEVQRIINHVRKRVGMKIGKPSIYNFNRIWENLIKKAELNQNSRYYYGCFANYDDTPRRAGNGKVVLGSSPEKFENYLTKLLKICKKQHKEYLFITAWNEWGEGAYLEPDNENGYAYLEAVKRAMESCSE